MKYVLTFLAVLVALIAGTFTIYYLNLDMKLVRVVYDKLQLHYDKIEKDKKL